jgi:hypothetical protein
MVYLLIFTFWRMFSRIRSSERAAMTQISFNNRKKISWLKRIQLITNRFATLCWLKSGTRLNISIFLRNSSISEIIQYSKKLISCMSKRLTWKSKKILKLVSSLTPNRRVIIWVSKTQVANPFTHWVMLGSPKKGTNLRCWLKQACLNTM